MAKIKTEKRSGIFALFLKFSVGPWVSAALSFFTTPVVTALIVPNEFGRASMFNLAYSFALQIVLLGADQSFVRKFYEEDYNKNRAPLLHNCVVPALGIGLLLSIVCLVFWKPLSLLLIQQEQFEICLLLAVTIIIGILERYAVLVVRMYKKGLLFSTLRIVASLTTFLVIVLYCRWVNKNLYAILYSTLVPLVLTTIIAVAAEWRLWFGKLTLNRQVIRSVLRYGIPFIPTFLAYWIFEGIDKIALRRWSTFEEIGLFAAAFKIVGLLNILQTSFSTFWAPVAYEAYERQTEGAKLMFKRTFAYLSLVFFVAAIGISACRDVIMLFFDKAYYRAGAIMPFLLFVPVMYTLSEVTVGGINFRNKTHLHFIITVSVALANVAGAALLVPLLGAKGAAISTGLVYVFFFYFRTLLSTRLFPVDFGLKRVTLSVVLLLLNAAVHSFFPTSWWTICLSGLLILLLLVLYRDEVQLFLTTTKRKLKFA